MQIRTGHLFQRTIIVNLFHYNALAGINGRLELRIITQPFSEVYWWYFGRLGFGNSLTKHNKIGSFSYSVVICFLPLSHIPPCYHANPPDLPRRIGPRELVVA